MDHTEEGPVLSGCKVRADLQLDQENDDGNPGTQIKLELITINFRNMPI